MNQKRREAVLKKNEMAGNLTQAASNGILKYMPSWN